MSPAAVPAPEWIRLCPSCGKHITGDEHTRGGMPPRPMSMPCTGEHGLCVMCGTLLRWTGNGWLTLLGHERAEAINSHPDVERGVMMHREYMSWRESDIERLREICQVWISTALATGCAAGLPVTPQHEQFIVDHTDTMVSRLIEQGYHTHRLGTM